MKTLYEYFSMVDDQAVAEVTVIVAGLDIQLPDRAANLLSAAAKYRIMEQPGEVKRAAMSKSDKFPGLGVTETWSIKLKLGVPPDPKLFAQEVSVAIKVPEENIFVEVDASSNFPAPGRGPTLSEPEANDANAQSMVGQFRIDNLVKSISKEMKDAAAERVKALKTVVVSASGMRDIFESPVAAGFYVCEVNGAGEVISRDGPHASAPSGLVILKSRAQLKQIMEEIR